MLPQEELHLLPKHHILQEESHLLNDIKYHHYDSINYTSIVYEEEETDYKKITPEEETRHINIYPEEESLSKYPLSLVPTSESSSELSSTLPQEETFTAPNLKNVALSKPLNGGGYGPLNINISYNSQNSKNNLNDGIRLPQSENEFQLTNPIQKPSKNLGPIGNCGLSRIYNNSDWIYGSNAWTNDPDYYIPGKDCPPSLVSKSPIPLNEIAMKKFKNNDDVCPLEINTPWSQWLTGDSDPEPFNL